MSILNKQAEQIRNLEKRFPELGKGVIKKVLRSNANHAGRAAAELQRIVSAPAASGIHVVLILGKPASGKSTLGTDLSARLGYQCFDIDAHVCLKKPPLPGLSLDDFVLDAVGVALSRAQHTFLIGFPTHASGMEFLISKARIILAVVLQVADEHVLHERAAARHENQALSADEKHNLQHQFEHFSQSSGPVLEKLREMGVAYFIDASQSKEEVEEAAYSVCAETIAKLTGAMTTSLEESMWLTICSYLLGKKQASTLSLLCTTWRTRIAKLTGAMTTSLEESMWLTICSYLSGGKQVSTLSLLCTTWRTRIAKLTGPMTTSLEESMWLTICSYLSGKKQASTLSLLCTTWRTRVERLPHLLAAVTDEMPLENKRAPRLQDVEKVVDETGG